MGLKDRDYMKREGNEQNQKPKQKETICKNKIEKAEKKYYSAFKNISLTWILLGLIMLTTIMTLLPSKTYLKNQKTNYKNEKQQIVKNWEKSMICDSDGENCKTTYKN